MEKGQNVEDSGAKHGGVNDQWQGRMCRGEQARISSLRDNFTRKSVSSTKKKLKTICRKINFVRNAYTSSQVMVKEKAPPIKEGLFVGENMKRSHTAKTSLCAVIGTLNTTLSENSACLAAFHCITGLK